jgi:hypothetical protein
MKKMNIGLGKCLKQESLLQFFIKITSLKMQVKSSWQKELIGICSRKKLLAYHLVMKLPLISSKDKNQRK